MAQNVDANFVKVTASPHFSSNKWGFLIYDYYITFFFEILWNTVETELLAEEIFGVFYYFTQLVAFNLANLIT